jgi:hypothetical protein
MSNAPGTPAKSAMTKPYVCVYTQDPERNRFAFCDLDGRPTAPQEWLRIWACQFPSKKFDEEQHDTLLSRCGSLSAQDFRQMGKWKDAATGGRWKPNVASVAYDVWMLAARRRPRCPHDSLVAAFLQDWSERRHTVGGVPRRFGLSRATTLLYFTSGGRFPIFDSRVRRAMTRLLDSAVTNDVRWYLDLYCPLFSEIVALCKADSRRTVDKALFTFGDRRLTFPR